MRHKLPNRRECATHALCYSSAFYAVSIHRHADGTPAEVFISSGNPSSDSGDLARDAGILISIALQYGTPLAAMRKAMTRTSGMGAASVIGAVLDLVGLPPPGETNPCPPAPAPLPLDASSAAVF